MISGVASRPGGLVWIDVSLLMVVTSKGIGCARSYVISKELFNYFYIFYFFCTLPNKCTMN